MGRLSAKVVVGLVLAGAVSVGSFGCADNESTLFIVGVAKIESDCTYAASGATTLLPRGVFDLGFNGSYEAGLVLANQMATRGQKARSRTETSRIILEGAEVDLVLPDGARYREEFSAPGAGFVDVATGDSVGYGSLSVVLIPRPSTAESARTALEAGYVIAEIKAFGRTLGGQEVESNVFRFPIEVCYGCLVSFAGSALTTDSSGMVTCALSAAEEGATAPCNWGQDAQVGCSACAASFDVCVAPGATLP